MDREREMYRSPEWRDWVQVTQKQEHNLKKAEKHEHDSKSER